MRGYRAQRFAVVVVLLLASWEFFYRLGDVPLLDDPSEGQYSEVAREMLESGDWLTPQLNYVPFLNKPPLSYWLIGGAYGLFGVNEFAARTPSALAGLLIVALTVWLGALIFDLWAGVLAGLVLVSMGGFFVETHEVRPDLLLTAAICATIVAVAKLFGADARIAGSRGLGAGSHRPGQTPLRTHRPQLLAGLQLAFALGLLSKGMPGLIIPGAVLGVLVLSERRWDLLRLMARPQAWWLLLLIVVPWHALMSFKHIGFLWDYVINQHLLFFFDRKFPRDSTSVSLGVLWSAFALRLFPWTLFVPLAFGVAAARWHRHAQRFGYRLVLAWVVVVLGFFSAASSRMEHYVIPALPAMALLLGKMFADFVRGSDRQSSERDGRRATGVVPSGSPPLANLNAEGVAWGAWLSGMLAAFALMTLSGPTLIAPLIREQEWLQPNVEFVALGQTAFWVLAAGSVLAAIAALAGFRAWVVPAFSATFAAIVPSFLHGLTLLAPVNSSAGLAATLRAGTATGARIVFEVPTEYQYCAGMIFYLRHHVDMLEPPGFVAPTYLEPHLSHLFIDRAQLQRRWQNEAVLLVTDPLASRETADSRIPSPHDEVAHDYSRQIFSN